MGLADLRSPSILVCCSEMLCDLTRVNDAFDFGYWWDDDEGEPLRLHEWLSDKQGDVREIEECHYCGRTPLSRFEEDAQGAPPYKWRWGKALV